MSKKKKGFTLAELLIIVAIVGILVAVSIPIFTNQLEKARRATDMANMRSAYAVLNEGLYDGKYKQGETYYYDALASTLHSEVPSKSYGKANSDASTWWSSVGIGTASGVPKDRVLQIKMNEDGAVTFTWGGAYAGFQVTNSSQHESLSNEEKVNRDLLLLNSLQSVFRNMTYGELHDLFFNGTTLKPEFSGKPKTGENPENLVGSLRLTADSMYDSMYDSMCVTIAESTIITHEINTTGDNHNKIYLPAIFQSAGYNVSEKSNENYIINSVDGSVNDNQGHNARIWVNLRIKQTDLKNLTSSDGKWNQKATTLYTYIKGAGTPTNSTNSCLSESTRKNQ